MLDSDAPKPDVFNPQVCALIHSNIDGKLRDAEKHLEAYKTAQEKQFDAYKESQEKMFGKLDAKVNALIMMLLTILLATLSLVLRSHFFAFLKLLEG